jgi:hypothetical protein
MRTPTIYLDWSTLCDAFKSTSGLSSPLPEYERLRSAIENGSRAGTLVLAPVHVSELLIWKPRDSAEAMAQWLDSLETTWVQAFNPDSDAELRWWLRRTIGFVDAPAFAPFVGDVVTAHLPCMSGPPSAEILRDPTLAAFVRNAHAEASVVDVRARAVEHMQRLHRDRTQDTADRPAPSDTAIVLHGKFRMLLIAKAEVLRLRDRSGRPLTRNAIEEAVDSVLAIPDSVPFNRLAQHLVVRLAEDIAREQPESKAFDARYRSIGYDLLHLKDR